MWWETAYLEIYIEEYEKKVFYPGTAIDGIMFPECGEEAYINNTIKKQHPYTFFEKFIKL